MTNRQPTPKEMEEARASNIKNTLESKLIQTSVGSGEIRTNQSQWGNFGVYGATTAYSNVMNGEEARGQKKAMEDQKRAEYQKYGVVGEPSISNSEHSLILAKQLEEALTIATFGEIEEHAKKIGAKLDFRVPEEMKDYSITKLSEKMFDKEKGTIDPNKLSEIEKEAYSFYDTVLSKVYQRACAVNTLEDGAYFADINGAAKQFGDKYKLPEESPASE